MRLKETAKMVENDYLWSLGLKNVETRLKY